MPTLSDFDSAARMKESIAAVAAEVVEGMIPRSRYGTVTAVNASLRQVTVVYPDEGTSVVLPGNTMLPGVGSVVRVSGYQGGRYIDDVLSGPVQFTDDVNVLGDITASGNVSGATLSISGLGSIPTLSSTTIEATTINATTINGPVTGSGANITGLPIVAGTTGTLTVARGGTGATDAATARTNLGLAAMSVSATASTLVQRDVNGYIFGNYINMGANIVDGPPAYVAGRDGGDSYMRWYTRVNGSAISGNIGTGTYTVPAARFGYVSGGGNTTGGTTGGNGAVLLDDSGNNYVHFDWNGSALLFYVDSTFIFYATPGSILNSAGTKTFVIDHPTKGDSYLVHACAEGPTTDVFYRGRGRLGGNGLAVVDLPEYFDELTTLNRTISLTGIGGPAPWVETDIMLNTFIVKGEPGQEFFWRVDAERKNARFEVEPLKSETVVEGFGPYRFVR